MQELDIYFNYVIITGMKTLFLVGNILFSAPSVVWQSPCQFALQLNFNDNKQRTLSYDLVPYVPTIAQDISFNKSGSINFSLLSSSDWDLIQPFLPLVKAIQVLSPDKSRFLYRHYSRHLDEKDKDNDQIANMSFLFLKMKENSLEQLIKITQIAYFFEITEIYNLSIILLLHRLKKSAENLEFFVQYLDKIPLNIQWDIRRIILSSKISMNVRSARYLKNDKKYKKEYYLGFAFDLNGVCKVKEIKVDNFPVGNDLFSARINPPRIVEETLLKDLNFVQLLFLRHIKKSWKHMNLKHAKKLDVWDTNNFECVSRSRGFPTYFKIVDPKCRIQVCKHTYPHALEIYNSLDSINSLKTMTTRKDCTLCLGESLIKIDHY